MRSNGHQYRFKNVKDTAELKKAVVDHLKPSDLNRFASGARLTNWDAVFKFVKAFSAIIFLLFVSLPVEAKTFTVTYTISRSGGYQFVPKAKVSSPPKQAFKATKAQTQSKDMVAAAVNKKPSPTQVPDESEAQIIAKLPHAELVAHIYQHESSFGKNDVCRKKGMYNGFGYAESNPKVDGPTCFSTFEAVATQVSMWIEQRRHLSNAHLTCLYIRGVNGPNCDTAYKFL